MSGPPSVTLAAALVAVTWAGCSSEPPTGGRDAAVYDAGPRSDGAPGVDCLGNDCEPGRVCCRTMVLPPNVSFFCVDEYEQCGDRPIACDGPEDCDGGLCCAHPDGVRCATDGACGTGSQVCHTAMDCPIDQPACCDSVYEAYRICCGG